MTIEFQLQYMRQKAIDRNNNELKVSNNTTKNSNELIDKSTTKFGSVTNMTDAYQAVRNSNHIPTDGEIHLRRFTSGSYVDINPIQKK